MLSNSFDGQILTNCYLRQIEDKEIPQKFVNSTTITVATFVDRILPVASSKFAIHYSVQ